MADVLRSMWLRWLLGLVALLALAAAVAWQLLQPKKTTPQQTAAEMKQQAQLTGAAKTYAATCAHCHDTKIGPDLRGRALPAEAVRVIARRGVGSMPAFGPAQIDDAQLAELAAYIGTLPARTTQ